MNANYKFLFSRQSLLLLLAGGVVAGLTSFLREYFHLIKGLSYSGDGEQWIFLSITALYIVIVTGIFWYVVYKVFNDKKACIASYAAGLLIAIILQYINLKFRQAYPVETIIISFLLSMVPVSTFMYMVSRNTVKSVIAGFIAALLGLNLLTYVGFYNMTDVPKRLLDILGVNYDTIAKLFIYTHDTSDKSFSTLEYWPLIATVFVNIALYFVKIEAILLILRYPLKEIGDTKLDLSINYTKAQAALRYFSTRIAIDATIFGFIGLQTMQNSYAVRDHATLNYVLWTVAALAGLFLYLWVHRKYLIEFLFTYNKVPSWFYWLLNIPFLNIIIFATGLLFFHHKADVAKRYENFKNVLSLNSSVAIGSIIVITQLVISFISLFNGHVLETVVRFVVLVLVLMFISGRLFAFYILIALYLALAFIVSIFAKSMGLGYINYIAVIYPFGFAILYMMYGIFQIRRFKVTGEPEDDE